MEAPATVVKTAIQPGALIKLALGTLAIFAILDLLKVDVFAILKPVTWAKAKWGSKPAA